MRFENDDIKLDGLARLTKALKIKNPPHINVGILGTKGERNGKGMSNAAIGAVHEYGSPARNIPSRSFLRMPLQDHLQDKMEASGALNQKVLEEVVKAGSIMPWLEKIKLLAKATVIEAFETAGWGKWARWKDPNYKNNAMMILHDTGQLQDAQDAEIKS